MHNFSPLQFAFLNLFPNIFLLIVQPLSILCRSFHDIDVYTMGFPRGDNLGHPNLFRSVKQCLPGPVSMVLLLSGAL